jgi:hypothetical protein
MALPVLVAHTTFSLGSGTSQVITTGAIGAGEMIGLMFGHRSGAPTVASINDDRSNVWGLARLGDLEGSARRAEIWYALDCAAGITNITVNYSGTQTVQGTIVRLSGIATSLALDTSNKAITSPSGTSHSHGSVTTYAGEGVILTMSVQSGNTTETTASGYADLSKLNNTQAQYRMFSITETTDGAYTSSTSVSQSGVIAVFKSIPAGVTQNRRRATYFIP